MRGSPEKRAGEWRGAPRTGWLSPAVLLLDEREEVPPDHAAVGGRAFPAALEVPRKP